MADYVVTSKKYYRPNEVNHLLGDPTKQEAIRWKPELDFKGLVDLMVESDIKRINNIEFYFNKVYQSYLENPKQI